MTDTKEQQNQVQKPIDIKCFKMKLYIEKQIIDSIHGWTVILDSNDRVVFQKNNSPLRIAVDILHEKDYWNFKVQVEIEFRKQIIKSEIESYLVHDINDAVKSVQYLVHYIQQYNLTFKHFYHYDGKNLVTKLHDK